MDTTTALNTYAFSLSGPRESLCLFLETVRVFCLLLRNITYIQNGLGNPRMGYEKSGFLKYTYSLSKVNS